MKTRDHDATDAEISEALLRQQIGPLLDNLGLIPFEEPDPQPNRLTCTYEPGVHVVITVNVVRE